MILGKYWIGEGPKRNDSRGILAKGSGSGIVAIFSSPLLFFWSNDKFSNSDFLRLGTVDGSSHATSGSK